MERFPTSASEIPDTAGLPINLSLLLERCGGDPRFAAAVVEKFRTQARLEVDRMQTALTDGDVDALRRAAHGLKSMAAYLSADAAAKLSKQIEDSASEQRLDDLASSVADLRAEIERVTAWIARNVDFHLPKYA